MNLTFDRDGIKFYFKDEGSGVPFVYQHGLGADITQPFSFFTGGHRGIRLLSMDCRAHGQTRPLGPEEKIALSTFADDVVATPVAKSGTRLGVGRQRDIAEK